MFVDGACVQVAAIGGMGLEGQFLPITCPSSTDGLIIKLMAGMGDGRHFSK